VYTPRRRIHVRERKWHLHTSTSAIDGGESLDLLPGHFILWRESSVSIK